jgi:hypothetical protein
MYTPPDEMFYCWFSSWYVLIQYIQSFYGQLTQKLIHLIINDFDLIKNKSRKVMVPQIKDYKKIFGKPLHVFLNSLNEMQRLSHLVFSLVFLRNIHPNTM